MIASLEKHDYLSAAFNSLVHIPGLWCSQVHLGVMHKIKSLHCDEVSIAEDRYMLAF
jgi:hypothetical protein